MQTEIGKHADFSQLRYAQCWEDADVLLAALAPLAQRRIFSIASAGDNTLALLAHGPARVVATDLSRAQIASLELRVAAYRVLDYPATMHLLGVKIGSSHGVPANTRSHDLHPEQRLDLYTRCRPLLSMPSQNFWDAHAAEIGAGIVAQGRFERYLRLFSRRILPLIHSASTRHALLQPRTLLEREKFYTTVWDTWRWRLLFRIFFSRLIMGRLGRDPAFFRYAEGSIADSVLKRTRHALTLLDPMHNPYLQWILLGRHGSALPFALRPQNFPLIRRHLDRLEWHTTTLEEYLAATPSARFDGFNLSNVFEYMSVAAYHSALEHILGAANAGARLLYWNLLVTRRRPPEFANRLLPLDSLAATLHRRDRAFFYRDLVLEQATIQSPS